MAAALANPAMGGDPEPVLSSSEAIRLSGDRVRYWDDPDGVRWAILEGHAAALQATDGIRADAIVARISKVQNHGQSGFEVEIHAEGNARTGDPTRKPQSSLHDRLASFGKIELSAYEKGGLSAVAGPPDRLPILARGFPDRHVMSPPPPASEVSQVAEPAPVAVVEPPPLAKADTAIRRVQDEFSPFDAPPVIDDIPPAMPEVPEFVAPPAEEMGEGLGPDEGQGIAVPRPGGRAGEPPAPSFVLPESRRRFNVIGGPNYTIEQFGPTDAGDITYVMRGGVNIVADLPRRNGPPPPAPPSYQTVDVTADNVVIWTKKTPDDPNRPPDQPKPEEPLQLYMEGNVIIRQDGREVAGKGDEKVFKADRAYYDLRTQRLVALDGEFFASTPGLLAPLRTKGSIINQYREVQGRDNKGRVLLGPELIRINDTMTTGSRFPEPGYRFNSKTIEIENITEPLVDEATGGRVGPGDTPDQQQKLYQFRAYNNTYFLGRVPVFYLPYTRFNSDFDPILRNIRFQTGNVFGQQLQFDLSAFRLVGLDKPVWIDNWNVDFDYLSYRGIGIGSEIGWFGRDLVGDVTDPYGKNRARTKARRDVDRPYFGYLDLWGIQDYGVDNLGPGPAVITYGPPGLGKQGIQRSAQPVPQHDRGRAVFRHMQRFVGDDDPLDEDLRFQLEAGYISDRNFLEEYYKRLFDTGYDQETLFYGVYQKQNRALTLQTEANLQNYYTDTQWLPKLEYTRLGDSVLNDWVNVSTRVGVDYANTHTAVEVNNPNVFAFIPYDPVSNTSGPLRTGRGYAAGEADIPLNFEFLKVVPYVQGQAVGWDNQLGGQQLGRLWGAVGARANILAWRTWSVDEVNSELLNVHGLAHKVDFQADFRSAYSSQPLQYIGVQDDLDDNTYEYTRRYFAMTNYVGGILPAQYDPRLLTLRRTVSPITGTTDIQDTIMTARLGIHQRLQTKRGKEGQRRIIDYMTFDVDTTYFPNANRDNFGKPFGQNTYNYEWFLGDRTSFTSYGWFEFWNVQGKTIPASNPRGTNDPFGLSVITSGFSIARPPRGYVFIGYSIINTGPIATSALNLSYTYWLSPKWYAYTAMSYDFGNAILLGTTFSLTKITKDYLTSLGLNVDPQRSNYTFAFELAPRFSPNVRLGSNVGTRFDSRFAASQ